MPTPNTFDQYAADYDATVQAAIGASGESVVFFAELKARLTRDLAPAEVSRILDFGCGTGNLSRALAAEFPAASVAGTDSSALSLDAARARSAQNIRYELQGESGVPFADDSFDLVVAACVFHHVDVAERASWVREIRRVLRPGGRLVLFEHNPLNPLTRRVVSKVPFDEGVVLLRRRDAEQVMTAGGLRIRKARYYFFFPRLLAALRPLERLLGWVPLGAQYVVAGER